MKFMTALFTSLFISVIALPAGAATTKEEPKLAHPMIAMSDGGGAKGIQVAAADTGKAAKPVAKVAKAKAKAKKVKKAKAALGTGKK